MPRSSPRPIARGLSRSRPRAARSGSGSTARGAAHLPLFLQLAGQGYFDGLLFHRVVPDFVAQGGDPRGDGWGGPGYTLRDEINRLRYGRGAVGMALSGPDTGGSQFFVALAPQPHLDGGYTVFGQVDRRRRGARPDAPGGPACVPPRESRRAEWLADRTLR